MKVLNKTLEELIPYENNPRRNDHAVEYVAKSIEQFGFKVPLVIDSDNVIVTGHTRYKAAKQLGMTEVPCIVADDLTEEQIKAFRLADNKVGEIATWDFELMRVELDELAELDIDMSDFGFTEGIDDFEVDGFFEDTEPKDKEEVEEKEIQCPHCKMYFTVK